MTESSLNDQKFVSDLRRDMVRFADLQLRDKAAAEDAAQEALAAAPFSRSRIPVRASLHLGVVDPQNKIVDILRQRTRQVAISSQDDDQADIDSWFDNTDHWMEDTKPADWGNPESRCTTASSGRSSRPACIACLRRRRRSS